MFKSMVLQNGSAASLKVALIQGDTHSDCARQYLGVFASADSPTAKVVLVSDQNQTGQRIFSHYVSPGSSVVQYSKSGGCKSKVFDS